MTVVVPFFNPGDFLRVAVESVFAQTFADWELFLVDDGSKDGSSTAARNYAAEHPDRVRLLEHPGRANRGINASLNLAIASARGGWIAFLDSDDVWMPRKLEEQLALAQAHPEVGLVFGRSVFWHGWTGRDADRLRDTPDRLGVVAGVPIAPPAVLTKILRRETAVPCPSTVLVRREALAAMGGLEESLRLDSHADQLFYGKILLRTKALASTRCWILYRQHASSCIAVAKNDGTEQQDRLIYLEWLGRHFAREGVEDPDLLQALQARLEHARRSAGARPAAEVRKEVRKRVGRVVRRLLPGAVREGLRRIRSRSSAPGVGRVRFGDLRRLRPIGRRWGAERGTPVDRLYIEAFLERNAGDIRGRVLEIGDDTYTWRFGGLSVLDNDVLDVREGNPGATIVADLANAGHIPSDRFDCIVFTQTLHLLYDLKETVRTLHRILKPSGVLLATVPGISPIGRPADWGESWHWSFTAFSARRLFREAFPESGVTVESKGNLLAAAAFLYGLAAEELTPQERDHDDPSYPVSILVRAVKADEGLL